MDRWVSLSRILEPPLWYFPHHHFNLHLTWQKSLHKTYLPPLLQSILKKQINNPTPLSSFFHRIRDSSSVPLGRMNMFTSKPPLRFRVIWSRSYSYGEKNIVINSGAVLKNDIELHRRIYCKVNSISEVPTLVCSFIEMQHIRPNIINSAKRQQRVHRIDYGIPNKNVN